MLLTLENLQHVAILSPPFAPMGGVCGVLVLEAGLVIVEALSLD